jgi:aquaporin Z
MYAKSPGSRERGWALALMTRARWKANVEVMNVIARREVMNVLAPTAASRKYAVELIGTFFLVLTVGVSVMRSSPLAPLAIGAVLMVMIYAGGHISGGHYNPAVTVAALVRGRIGLHDATRYWIAQLCGGLLAAMTVGWLTNRTQVKPLTLSGHTLTAAFVVELLFTFALCYVVLNVATSRNHPDNSYYGLAIGFTVMAGAIAAGGISGAAFNPAVALGAATMGLFAWPTLWVYLLAQLIAAVAAGSAFLTLNPDDK